MNLHERPLLAADFDGVVDLDARIGGSARRAYFGNRLRAALRQPHRHLQLAVSQGDRVLGFVLARKAGGEYGDPDASVVLEAFGVDPDHRHRGIGRVLLEALEGLARERSMAAVATQADWREHGILRFLHHARFELAPRRIFELTMAHAPITGGPETPAPRVRTLRESDLAALTQIDERITGTSRAEYLKRKVDEALNESAIQVSLVAEDDGFPVGFAMARVDSGDYGRMSAAASLDTIGVDPRFARKGFASALLTQMIDNLAALHVERLETEVAPGAHELQRFLLRSGFAPSQRLAFRKAL